MGVCPFFSLEMISWLVTDAAPSHRATMVEELCTVLKHYCGLEVECECITKRVLQCTAKCCTQVTKAAGVVMVLPGKEAATAFAEPAALTPN